MGTTMDVVIPGMTEETGPRFMRDLRNELALLEGMLSNYDGDSEISRFNRTPVTEAFTPSEPLLEIISFVLRYSELTGGLFDFMLGKWTSPPDRDKDSSISLQQFLEIPPEQRLEVKDGILRRLHPDTCLDAGGFGKGVALRSAEKLIRNAGITSAFISFGRSSVLAVGSHPQGNAWKVGIQDTEDAEKSLGVVELSDKSLSITGNSANNRKKFGDSGHVLDPLKGRFNNAPGQVTVTSADPLEAEVLSTALFASLSEGQILDREKFPGAGFYFFKD